MPHSCYDKTDKGREEIATRCHRLAPRLRPLLLLFDGKKNTQEVLSKVVGMGLNDSHVSDLERDGYIVQVSGTASAAAPFVPIVPPRRISMPLPTAAAVPPVAAPAAASSAGAPPAATPTPPPPPVTVAPLATTPEPSATSAAPPAPDEVRQALYDFYSDTIRSAVGLRGYALQLKVERARTVEDFEKIRPDYLAAVEKAQGRQAALELNVRLQQLLANAGGEG